MSTLRELITSLALACTLTATNKPNIVLILSDDQAWGDYGFMGHEVRGLRRGRFNDSRYKRPFGRSVHPASSGTTKLRGLAILLGKRGAAPL